MGFFKPVSAEVQNWILIIWRHILNYHFFLGMNGSLSWLAYFWINIGPVNFSKIKESMFPASDILCIYMYLYSFHFICTTIISFLIRFKILIQLMRNFWITLLRSDETHSHQLNILEFWFNVDGELTNTNIYTDNEALSL